MRAAGIKTQNDLATRLKTSQSNVSRWLDGGLPESRFLEAMSETLGAPWQWLLIGDEGLKAMGALSPRDPIVIKIGDRDFSVASYRETEIGISVYEVTHRRVRTQRIAATMAAQEKEKQKL